MQLFLDTANLEEIREAAELGVISGVTTNPTLVAKEGRDFRQLVKEIACLVPGPVSAEVISTEAAGMIREARELATLGPNVVIKIPMLPEGLKAVKVLSADGIRTNVTLVFTVNQALLAARAGAAYVSPFLGRLDDIGQDGLALLKDIVQVFKNYNFPTKTIAASIRHPVHVAEAAKIGADIATIPYKVLRQMMEHPLTTSGVERFLADWEAAKNLISKQFK